MARLQRADEEGIGNRRGLREIQLPCEEYDSIFRRKRTREGVVERYGDDVKIGKSCVAGRESRAAAGDWSERTRVKRAREVRASALLQWAKTVKRWTWAVLLAGTAGTAGGEGPLGATGNNNWDRWGRLKPAPHSALRRRHYSGW